MIQPQPMRIMIVEDDSLAAMDLSRLLIEFGLEVTDLVSSEKEALNKVEQGQPDIILMDIDLGAGGSGIEVTRKIREKWNIPVIYLTAFSDDKTVQSAIETSPYGYVTKPFKLETLKTALYLAQRRFELEKEIKRQNARLNAFTDISKIGQLLLNKDGVIALDSPESFNELLGSQQSISWSDFQRLFPHISTDDIRNALENGEVFNTTVKVANRQNQEEPYRYFNVVFCNCHVNGERVEIGAVQDITQQKALHYDSLISNAILSEIHEGVLILDKHKRIRRYNNAALQLFGKGIESMVGQYIGQLFYKDRRDDQLLFGEDEAEFARKEIKIANVKPEKDCMVSITELKEPAENYAFVAIISDITKLKASERKLTNLAFKDNLTGVGNRNLLTHQLQQIKESKTDVSLIFIDLDGFKSINDNFGHEIGDQLLIDTARRLNRFVRSTDSLIRFGGDEFVIVVQDDIAHSEMLAKRLIESFQQPFLIDDFNITITASIGIAKSSEHMDFSELLRHADIAMFNAKKRGKNVQVSYQDNFKKEVDYRLYVEQGLYRALENEEIIAHYQPIVGMDGKITAFEALARWANSSAGLIPPDRFISVAEDINLIHGVGIRIFKEACIAFNTMQSFLQQPFYMHINVSNVQLQRSATVEMFESICGQLSIEPQYIVIEVTETTVQNQSSRRQLQRLREKGFKVAIDDFGTGFSSIQELKQFEYDIVKLDKSMLHPDVSLERTTVVLENLIRLFNAIDTPVLAEGVETSEQVALCRKVQCQYLQGFKYAKPMSLTELAEFVIDYQPIQ